MVMRKVEPPAGMRGVIHALLKPHWNLQQGPRSFVSGENEVVPDPYLPPETQINYLVSRLQKVDRDRLTPEEEKLSRWVQIVLPQGTEAEQYLAELRAWPCFAEVHVVPPPSLPSPGAIRRPT